MSQQQPTKIMRGIDPVTNTVSNHVFEQKRKELSSMQENLKSIYDNIVESNKMLIVLNQVNDEFEK